MRSTVHGRALREAKLRHAVTHLFRKVQGTDVCLHESVWLYSVERGIGRQMHFQAILHLTLCAARKQHAAAKKIALLHL